MKKFLIGCGVLSGVAILLLVGASFFAVRWVKNNAPDLDRLEQLEVDMQDAYGEPAEFVPPAGGAYELDRARTYAQVRRSLYDVSVELRERMQKDASQEGEKKKGLRKLISGFRSGAAYLKDSFEYLADADSILLASDMGRGEYVHWTGLLVRGGMSIDGADYLDFDLPSDDRGALQSVGIEFEEEARKVFLEQFENLRRQSEDDDAWVRLVQDERARVRRQDGLWPFSDRELPPRLAEIFTALESELRATAPRDAAGLMLDNVLGAKVENDKGGVQVNFD